jgi:Amt family ammonium transporter
LGGGLVYGVLKLTLGLKHSPEEEYEGADLIVHKISTTSDREVSW